MTTLAPSFLNLTGKKDFHTSLNEFDFSPHPYTSYTLAALERQKYNCIMLLPL